VSTQGRTFSWQTTALFVAELEDTQSVSLPNRTGLHMNGYVVTTSLSLHYGVETLYTGDLTIMEG
jgi:hypothetical protein